jgi:VCBS repeat-containing protein
VTVSLIDVNEAPDVNNQLFIVNENSPNGTIVGTVVATDPDAGQTLAYSILSGNVSNDFVINATTGVISVANSLALNFEENSSFALLINVQDNGTGNLSSQAIATVALNDVNEAPVINNQFFTVAENSSIGTAVGTVVSTDPDAGQAHVYSIVSGNENGTFIISATSGIITIANSSALNFEENLSFAFVVKVQDNGVGNLSSQALITVSLSDVNENPTVNNQTFSVYEFVQNGTEVGTVQANDPDAGQILSYTITAGNTNNAFAINSSTGLITTLNSAAISYLSNPVFNLMIRVSDNGSGNLFDDCIVTIHVLPEINQPPVINDQTFFVNENSINGSSVGFVEAYDPDAGQIINYSILSGNTADAFSINSLTGEITVSNSLALNYITNPVFTLTVNVQDNGTLSLEDQATITINLIDTNEPPVITDQLFSTTEHKPIGTQVCTVVASGSGSGNSLSYSIEAGNIGNGFAINSNNGDLTISNPNAVCYEGNPEFDLLVKVQDTEGLSAEAIVTVNVMDINEHPVCNNQIFTIEENTLSNTIVGTVIATEPDFNQTLTYTIISGNSNDAFSLNETDGLIKVNNSAALNYEENQMFTLIVSVQDNGIGNLITNSTITINLLDVNEYPVFENQVFDVVENSVSGTEIGYLSASDPDAGQSINYNIIGGNENQTFTLNPATGLLSVADPALMFFDLNPVYILTVIAQDNSADSLVTLALVTINVIKELEGEIIYIDPTNENDLAENGSIDHPYDSWEDFTFKNGSTYLQRRGTTYKSNNSIIISKKTNINLDAYGNGTNPVIINFQTASHSFEFDNTINCVIRNLEIMSDQKGTSCIYVTGDESKSLTIENCKLHNATFGISSNSRIKDLKILNTGIYNTGLDGINADEFISIEIRDCKISSVNQKWFSDPYAAGSCINLNSSEGKVYIHKNELDHTNTGNMSVVRMNGIRMEGVIEYNTLSGNKISDNHCLNLSNSSGDFIIRYNTILGGKTGVNVNSESVKIYYNQMIGNQVAIKVQQNKAALIMNNTFVANDNFAVESLTGSKISATNNIFYLTPAATKAFKYGGSYVSDFNLFNIEKSGFLNGYSTLALWIAVSGQDKNSQVKDPQFENGAEGNFRIKPNSPCINKGSDLKLEKDFFGTKVPQAGKPDIGFCEVENGSIDPEEETIPLVDLNSVIDLTVYPNPTTGILNIDLKKVIEQEVKIRIINMNGYQIYSTVSQGQKELEINLENEKSGMYVIHFIIGGMEFTKGVVVKR